MHFTVVFDGHEDTDLSYGLVFVPCPVWMEGKRELANLHPEIRTTGLEVSRSCFAVWAFLPS